MDCIVAARGPLNMLLAQSQFIIICSELILCFCFPFRTSWSIVFGTKYCKGHVIVAGIRHATPIFGEINEVLVLDGSEVLLQYAPLRVIQFTTHLNAYEVERGNGMSFIKQSDLEDFHPLGLCRGFGCNSTRFYVILEYNVDCLFHSPV